MRREPGRLAEGPFDLVVVGGGIYGAWTAYDAVLRGLRVAIVERDDWSGGTSQGSSKLIHGGLRYLESLRFGLVRKTLAERQLLLRLAPHRVRPVRFLLPVYRGSRTGRLRLGIGLWLYDRFAGSRSVGRHRRLSAERIRRRYPHVNDADLVGGFTYGDAQTDDARFTLEIVEGAAEEGAVAVNYCEATALRRDADGRVRGVAVRDRLTDHPYELDAPVVANCAGPWADRWIDAPGGGDRDPRGDAGPVGGASTGRIRLAKGVHLVMPALPDRRGILVLAEQRGRVAFLIPWYGRTLLGTTDTEFEGDPSEARVEPRDVERLLGQANSVLRGIHWRREDILAGYAAVRALPGSGGADGGTSSISREFRLHEPVPGLLTPVGGKYTSARADAIPIVDRVERLLGHTPRRSLTDERPFPWRPQRYRRWRRAALSEALAAGLDEGVAEIASRRYGARIGRLLDVVRADPATAARIVPDLPFVHAEVAVAVEHEMAVRLEDVVRRRVPVGLLARIDRGTMETIARAIQRRLGWDDARVDEEIARTYRALDAMEG